MQLAVIAVSFAIVGFVGGWIVRGEEGTVTELPPALAEVTETNESDGDPPTETAPTDEPADGVPARADVALIVLNGGTVDGLANETAEQAESLGYTDVIADNAPTQSGPTVVYYTAGNQAAAERAATDLEIGAVEALPETGELAAAVSQAEPSGSDVAVILGTQ